MPSALAQNHSPIICPRILSGASSVMVASPIGLRHSSPSVSIRILPTSHIGDTPAPPLLSTFCAASIIRPETTGGAQDTDHELGDAARAHVIARQRRQAQLNTGASRMMNRALIDWNHTAGISKSPTMRLV